jgi:high-affinity nickel permease
MTFDSVSVSNTFLACIALTNIIILTILYEATKKPKEK